MVVLLTIINTYRLGIPIMVVPHILCENVYKVPKITIIMPYYTLFTIRVVNISLVVQTISTRLMINKIHTIISILKMYK